MFGRKKEKEPEGEYVVERDTLLEIGPDGELIDVTGTEDEE